MRAPDGLVSVVIPVHDGARFVAEAIGSVLGGSFRPVELIVVDDGSTDDSAAVIRGFTDVLLLSQPNRGVSAARNVGVAAASGGLIAFLDQDDRWTPDKLAVQAAHLLRHPHLGYTLARQRLFLEPGAARPGWLRPEHLERDLIGYLPGTLLARRDVFARVGPFDEANPIASDTDWFLRAHDAGVALEVLPQVLLERRIHAANQSALTGPGHAQLLRAVRESVDRKRSAATGSEDRR